MDGDFLVAMVGSVMMVSVIGITINGIVTKVLDYKRSQAGIAAAGERPTQITSEIADRTEMIEDRLRVLERLATDRGQLLADEIEALRERALPHEKVEERA